MCMPDYANRAAIQAHRDERQRQKTIRTGMSSIDAAFSGFTPDFYSRRADAYKAVAEPELQGQYRDARRDAKFDLARSGNLGPGYVSSAGAERFGDIASLFTRGRQQIASNAIDEANRLKGTIEGERSQLVSQLNGTSNPDAARAEAYQRAQALSSAPSVAGGIGNIFANLSGAVADQVATPANGYAGLYRSARPKTGTVTVVR